MDAETRESIVTIPQTAYDEGGQQVEGPPVWKLRDQEIFKGVNGVTYPRLEKIIIPMNGGVSTRLEDMTVKTLTRDAVDKTTKRHTCEKATRWPVELNIAPPQAINWDKVWDTFKTGIATPVDFGTRFRMIIGDLGTRSKLGEAGGCRLGCGCAQEKHIHLLRCPVIKPIWNKLCNDPADEE